MNNSFKLRKELLPDMETAQKLYPLVLKRLQEYEQFHDAQTDDTPEEIFDNEYNSMEKYLSELVKKNLSNIWLWEWWEADGIEVFAFKLALPKPQKIENISKQELLEIVRIMNEVDFPYENDFQEDFAYHTSGWYIQFLDLNFPDYKYDWFEVTKNHDGSLNNPITEEITEKIWNVYKKQ